MRKVRLVGTALALLLALSVSGFAFAQSETVTLQVWTGSSSPAENEAKEAQFAAFEEANPNIDLEVLISPEYGTQVQAAFASGDYPDVFTVGQGDFPSLVDSGVLLPAGDYIESPETIYPGLQAAFTTEADGAYCVPKDFSTLALYYNTDLFDAAGVEYPTQEWTWEDMYAAAEAITNSEDVAEDVVGLSAAAQWDRWLAFLYGNGANIMGEDMASTINSPEAVEALEFYSSFVSNGVGALPSDLGGSGWNGEAFGKGLAAMTIEGNWAIGYLENDFPELNWGVAEIPAGPSSEGQRGTLTFTECWAVGANTEYPDEAWALVNFLTGEEGAAFVAESGFGVLPARTTSGEAWLEARGEQFAPFVTGAEYAVAPVFPLGYGDFTTALTEGTIAVLSGEMTAQEALDEAAEVWDEITEELMP